MPGLSDRKLSAVVKNRTSLNAQSQIRTTVFWSASTSLEATSLFALHRMFCQCHILHLHVIEPWNVCQGLLLVAVHGPPFDQAHSSLSNLISVAGTPRRSSGNAEGKIARRQRATGTSW